MKLLVNSFSVDKRLLPISYFARAIYQTKILFQGKDYNMFGKGENDGKEKEGNEDERE